MVKTLNALSCLFTNQLERFVGYAFQGCYLVEIVEQKKTKQNNCSRRGAALKSLKM